MYYSALLAVSVDNTGGQLYAMVASSEVSYWSLAEVHLLSATSTGRQVLREIKV